MGTKGRRITLTPEQQTRKQNILEELAVRRLSHFFRQAWPIIEPGTPLEWNWHLELICDELQAVTEGETQKLCICIPPGHAKSLTVSVMWPAWMWLRRPAERMIFLSNDLDLVSRDSRRTREIIESDWYRDRLLQRSALSGRIDGVWEMAKDQNQKLYFENTARGFRQCRPINARITGKRGDGIIIDDPYDVKELQKASPDRVAERMREVVNIYDEALSSRVNDYRTAYRVLILQRLHEEDLAGVLIRRGYRSVILPTEFEPDFPAELGGVHPKDPRTEPGELLFPTRIPPEVVTEIKTDLKARGFAAQHQQRPSPAEGGLFKRQWFRNYMVQPEAMARKCEELAISVDCTFKKGDDTDYVVLQVWGRIGVTQYRLIDQIRARMNYPETKQAVKMLLGKWPAVNLVLVEAKANGQALIDELRSEFPFVIGYDPKTSKEGRAQISALAYEASNVEVPHPQFAPWVDAYIEEHCAFPAASHDDQVDATSQMLIRWTVDTVDRSQWRRMIEEESMNAEAAKREEQIQNVRPWSVIGGGSRRRIDGAM